MEIANINDLNHQPVSMPDPDPKKPAGRPKRHGMSNSPTYITWQAMIQRCSDPKHKSYPTMGGRGIKVCERWLSFDNFLTDVGIRPEGAKLVRHDKDGGYCPENCFWGTARDVAHGDANAKAVTAFGETKFVADWARDARCQVPYTALKSRINMGWKAERAIGQLQVWRKTRDGKQLL